MNADYVEAYNMANEDKNANALFEEEVDKKSDSAI